MRRLLCWVGGWGLLHGCALILLAGASVANFWCYDFTFGHVTRQVLCQWSVTSGFNNVDVFDGPSFQPAVYLDVPGLFLENNSL